MPVDVCVKKSPSDDKQYRVIKLENGLVALLIEDHVGQDRAKRKISESTAALSPSRDASGASSSEGEGGMSDEDVGGATTDEEGMDSGGEAMKGDNRKGGGADDSASSGGEAIMGDDKKGGGAGGDVSSGSEGGGAARRTRNLLEVDGGKPRGKRQKRKESQTSMTQLDCEDLSAACGLCVNVGSFSDPSDIPGLAHLLEHMVFMGSEKYPGDNTFDKLTNRYGGFDNAFTDYERTVFTFSIQNKQLKEALDMFAHFFASPQLLKDCLNREIEAVDSEFQTSIQSDSSRLQQLLCSLAKPGHPYSKFVWGNSLSLKKNVKTKGIDLNRRLREFYQSMYSSHYMTLAVQSSDSLDDLESWVRESFSSIPNNHHPRPDFSSQYPPFEDAKFHKLIKVVPVKDVQQIELNWLLPPIFKYYRTKPLVYLGWLLGHEGKGSVLSYLKKRNYATSIVAGNGGMGFECNTCFSIFSCSIMLTDKGFANVDKCVQAVFEYLKMLQEVGPQERIFREIQKIEENAFNFQEDEEPVDNVEKLSENMQLYPPEEYLTGDNLLIEYDPECITTVTSMLTKDHVNVFWQSKSFASECKKQEEWFGINYTIQDIPQEWLSGGAGNDFGLALPAENIYIASEFTLVELASPPPQYPVLVDHCAHYRLWFKPDVLYENYKAWIGLIFETPLHTRSAENAVLMDMFVDLYSHVNTELTYEAEVAELEYSLEVTRRGLSLTVEGFSHKLHMLFKSLIDCLVKFEANSEDDFITIKEQLKRKYYNHLLKPHKLCTESRLKVLETNCWNRLDKIEAIEHVTRHQLQDVIAHFKKNMSLEALMQGNLKEKRAKELMKYVADSFDFQHNPPSVCIGPRSVQLPSNTVLTYTVANRDSESPNAALTDYYQCCAHSDRDLVMVELVMACMDEPCFDTLRTKKQLGYDVYCENHNTHGAIGFSVSVVTQTKKHSVAYAGDCMEQFVKKFSDKTLKTMKKSEFKAQVNSLIQLKLEPDFNMETEVKRNWDEIIQRQYKFDRNMVAAEILKSLSQQEVCEWLWQFTRPGPNYRRLAIRVVNESKPAQGAKSKPQEGYISQQLKAEDLNSFKRKLFLYPSMI